MANAGDTKWSIVGPLSLSDFEVGVTLGVGSFGRVRIATHKVRGSRLDILRQWPD